MKNNYTTIASGPAGVRYTYKAGHLTNKHSEITTRKTNTSSKSFKAKSERGGCSSKFGNGGGFESIHEASIGGRGDPKKREISS